MRLFKLISLLFIFLLISCKNNSSGSEEQTENTGYKNSKIWKVGQYVDEFGEPSDGKFLYTTVSGSFSNGTTTNSNLSVLLKVESDTTITLGLAEYGSLFVKDDQAKFKIKDNQGNVHEGTLRFDSEGSANLTVDSLESDYLLQPGELIFYIERKGDVLGDHRDNIPSTYRFKINDGSMFQEALDMLAR